MWGEPVRGIYPDGRDANVGSVAKMYRDRELKAIFVLTSRGGAMKRSLLLTYLIWVVGATAAEAARQWFVVTVQYVYPVGSI